MKMQSAHGHLSVGVDGEVFASLATPLVIDDRPAAP